MKHRAYFSATAALLDSTDWSSTPLGPMDRWPASLRGFVSMVMAMPAPAIIFWGPDLTQIYNDGYAEIMGPRHPRYFGAPYRACWPDTYPLIHPWMRRVLDDGEVVEVERERIPVTRLGFDEDAFFTFTFSALRDDEGRIAGILQPVFEVTDNVLAERRAACLRALSTIASGPDMWNDVARVLAEARDDIPEAVVCEIDHDGRVTPLAGTSAQLLATIEADAPGILAAASRHSPGASGVDPNRAVVLPLDGTAASGADKVLVARTNPRIRAGDAYALFLDTVAVELSSAMRRAEAATAEERQRAYLSRLFMQAPAGIAVLRGPDHVYELVNPMYRALIGHRDVTGLAVRDALPELAGQPFVGILDRVYRTGEPHVGLAEPARLSRDPDGVSEEVFLNYVYQPLRDDVQPGILVFCYEVTEQVRARQRSEQLAQALRGEHQRKDEFLAMLAHELRNPLAPIISAADLLLRVPSDADRVGRAGRTIARQAQHLSALIDDLLDVSRVTRGLAILQQDAQDLRAVLLDAVEQARPLVASRSQQLQLDLPAQRLLVRGDQKRLVQIFANLLNNAAKYTPDGGRITLVLRASDHHAVVTVADTGIGIDAELLPRVFDLFVQGTRGADRASGGLGIGLALARSLVQMQGGRIEAHSAGPGLGSRFEVTLPTLDASVHGAPSADGAEALPRDHDDVDVTPPAPLLNERGATGT